ncbi:MAG: Txe/YoeB family addiction module toxin [Thiotrichaceae bacterium]
MKLSFTNLAWEDYLWFQANERALLKKINTLIKDIQRTPYEGLGKPEALGANLSGYMSRRINHEHRLVYKIDHELTELTIVACRYHYHE